MSPLPDTGEKHHHKRAGRCQEHDELAWMYDDGSISCMWCLVVETSSSACRWEPMPTRWAKGLGIIIKRPDSEQAAS